MFAEFGEVVNLAIEDNPDGFIFVGHRLMTGRAEVDDAQAAVPERNCVSGAGEYPDPTVVRPAMSHSFGHPADQVLIRLAPYSSNAAHACSGPEPFAQRRPHWDVGQASRLPPFAKPNGKFVFPLERKHSLGRRDACPTLAPARFLVPMHAKKRKRTLHEP